MKRNKHNLSHYKLLTCDMGQLVPISCVEALPGDTFQQSTSALIRCSPMLAPVMHPVTVRIHHWFVPFRLLWDAWEDFITGGPAGTGTADPFPVNGSPLVVAEGDLADYLGLRPTTYEAGQVSMLPFRAYNMIFNEFYRDEDLVTALGEDDTDLQYIAWEKDYFTSARPWAQKGPAVTLPLGTVADVVPKGAGGPIQFLASGGSTPGNLYAVPGSMGVKRDVGLNDESTEGGNLVWEDPALEVDLSTATAANVRDIRLAFALQRYQEARAQYGNRYTEYLRYLGIRPSDARLQRPEYLGGGKQTLAFSEVLRTGTPEEGPVDAVVGEMKGHGIAALRSNRYRYFCEEHGYVMSMMSVRPKTMYVDGQHKLWLRRTKEQFYQRELELIGQQEITNAEVHATGTAATDNLTFGYNDRYAEYRRHPSQIAGQFRSTLDFWHLGRTFASTPTLNGTFVGCDPSNRIFADQTGTNTLWCMVNNNMVARRLLGNRTVGRII